MQGGLRRRGALAGVLGAVLAAQLVVSAAPGAAASLCQSFTGTASGTPYTATVCLDSPALGSTLSGTTEITASATVVPAGLIDRMVFWWGQISTTTPTPTYLLADHDAPYRMILDTSRFPNGSNVFSVRPVFVGGAVTARVGGAVTIDNPAPPPPDGDTFRPWLGGPQEPGERFRLAVVGDGVDGSPESHAVSDVIAAADPDAFAYIGDVYDRGTPQEFDTWYSDPASFGRFRDITNPTLGNHEYMESATAAAYFAYWHQIPHYYSYDIGGWHVAVIDSNTEFGQLAVSSPQYKWLKADIEANADSCTLLYAHHSRVTNVKDVNRIGLEPEWDLMVDRGGDIMLGGHAHTYERWLPMDQDQVPVTEGLTEFVVGTGGRPILNEKHPDNRTAADITTPGVLLLDLGDTDASYSFVSANGQYGDSGTIPCRTPPDVTGTASSTPPGDNGWHRGDVTLHWDVSDPESPTTVTTVGCEDVLVTADQPETAYTCTATSGGGTTTRSMTVKRDATPPLVTAAIDPLSPDGTNSWYVTQPTVTITCGDALSGVAHCPDPVKPGEGTSTITRTGRDVAGNTSEVTFGPVSVDLTDPVVTCDDKVTYLLHQTGTLVGASVTDAVSGPVRAREVLPVGTSTVGDQTATVVGTDLAGRASDDGCDFRVIYGFSGWTSPLDADAVNVVKAGRSVPLKWRLVDAAGVPVSTVDGAKVTTSVHACGTTTPEDPVEDVAAAGGSGLQNLGDGNYQYNWKTPTSYAGTCRTARLDLGDDLLRTLEFRFTA
jgi:hypothetical protein